MKVFHFFLNKLPLSSSKSYNYVVQNVMVFFINKFGQLNVYKHIRYVF